MESDKKLLISKGDMVFWISIFAAMGFFVGMFVSAGFDLQRTSARIEAADERIKEHEQEQKKIEEQMKQIYENYKEYDSREEL